MLCVSQAELGLAIDSIFSVPGEYTIYGLAVPFSGMVLITGSCNKYHHRERD